MSTHNSILNNPYLNKNKKTNCLAKLLKTLCLLTMPLSFISINVSAEEGKKITFGGYVDTNYAVDFNSPANGDRAYTTQPARNNEFNINLGYIDVKIDSAKTRGRLALQAGTSVQSNYSVEPRKGAVSGGDLSRHLQEAKVGYTIGEKTWIDAGVFFAHVGSESWISKDNLVLTRSLVADYSPYYLSGVKLTHAWTDKLTTQLLVTNGWQNISENNSDKNIGTAIEYAFDGYSLAYNTLIGNEISPDLNGIPRRGGFRHFHNFILKNTKPNLVEWIAQLDMGFQRSFGNSNTNSWWGTSVMARYKLNERQKISVRAEHYQDPDQIIIVTGVAASLNATGGSIGFDQTLDEGLLWRNEVRYLAAKDSVFPKEATLSKSNTTLTTSLALTF